MYHELYNPNSGVVQRTCSEPGTCTGISERDCNGTKEIDQTDYPGRVNNEECIFRSKSGLGVRERKDSTLACSMSWCHLSKFYISLLSEVPNVLNAVF